MIAFAVVLGILFLLLLLVGGVVFLILVKKNWIVLNWPYKVNLYKPSGGGKPLHFVDKAAIIKEESGKIMFKLQQAGFSFEIPNREFIQPGNEIDGWSSTMREFIPIQRNFVGFKKSPDPRVLEAINKCQDMKERARLMDEYQSKLATMELQWKPVVDNATVNSTIENTAYIIKNTPMKMDWLVWVGVGAAIMIIIVTFMISIMMQMKNADEAIKGFEVGQAQANALSTMASTLNQTNQINLQLVQVMNKTVFARPT
jgi:hypothetical protein